MYPGETRHAGLTGTLARVDARDEGIVVGLLLGEGHFGGLEPLAHQIEAYRHEPADHEHVIVGAADDLLGGIRGVVDHPVVAGAAIENVGT